MLLLINTSVANAEELTGHIGIFVGGKFMNNSDWGKLDKHNAMGYMFDIKKDSWPISISLDILDTGGKNEHGGMTDLGHTTEYHLGLRKIFVNGNSNFQPYIGGGISYMHAELELEVNNTATIDDDNTVGGWLGAGMYYELNPIFVLGLDVRYSHGEVILFDKERNAGGAFSGLTVGYQF
jgi:opacity protein-like surface antigen